MKELLIKVKVNCDCGKCENEYLEHIENHWTVDGGIVDLEIIESEDEKKKDSVEKYIGFDWDKFKEGELVVSCPTKEIAKDFLEKAHKLGYKWSDGRQLIDFDGFSIYENETVYSNTYDAFGYADLRYAQEGDLQVVVWEVKIMNNFDWDKFKKGESIAVNCKTKDAAIDFLKNCKDNGVIDYEIKKYVDATFNHFNTKTCYGVDGWGCFGYDCIKYHEKNDFEIIEWKVSGNSEKIYIAGSLFNEAEVNQRLKEENELRELGFNNIYNPISAPCNDKENNLPTSADIFWGDTKEVLSSDIVIADISNQIDLGVACELGIVWSCNYIHKLASEGFRLEEILEIMRKKELIAHLSDIRKSTSHLYKGNNIPFGFNQFEVGMVEDIGTIKDNFKGVLGELNGR